MTCTVQHVETQAGCWCDTEITTRAVTQQCNSSLWRCNINRGFKQYSWHLNSISNAVSITILPQLLWLHTNPDSHKSRWVTWLVWFQVRNCHLLFTGHSTPFLLPSNRALESRAGLQRGSSTKVLFARWCNKFISVLELPTIHVRWKSVTLHAVWINSPGENQIFGSQISLIGIWVHS